VQSNKKTGFNKIFSRYAAQRSCQHAHIMDKVSSFS